MVCIHSFPQYLSLYLLFCFIYSTFTAPISFLFLTCIKYAFLLEFLYSYILLRKPCSSSYLYYISYLLQLNVSTRSILSAISCSPSTLRTDKNFKGKFYLIFSYIIVVPLVHPPPYHL